MDGEKTYCDREPKTTPVNFTNLDFVRCVFFSNKQFNIDKIHLPKNILYFEIDVKAKSLSSIETTIDNRLKGIYALLNKDKPNPPIKIPYPFYLFISRVIEKDNSVFDGETFTYTPIGTSQLGTQTITTDGSGSLAIVDFINSYLNSGISPNKDNENNNYEGSYYNKYKFMGNVKIFMYFPYLTKAYTYVANFSDVVISSNFMISLINSDLLFNLKRTTILNEELLKNLNKNPAINKKVIQLIKEKLIEKDRNKFTLYEDLVNLCYEGGCLSSVGEDFDTLLYNYTNDEGKNNENALDKSPYMPTKCLSKTNGFLLNIRLASDENEDITTLLKTHGMDEVKSTLKTYSRVVSLINDLNTLKNQQEADEKKEVSGLPPEEAITLIMAKINRQIQINTKEKELDKYTNYMGASPIDLIISVAKKYKKQFYSNNENDGEREIKIMEKDETGADKETSKKIKLNHYSKEYSQNIITELSYLNSKYPGVPEVVMSFYIYKDNYKPTSSILTYMPWKNVLIDDSYVLNFGNRLEVDKELLSLSANNDNNYALTINKLGIVYVYNRNNKEVVYYLNKNVVTEPLGIIFTKDDITISYFKTLPDKSRVQSSLSILDKTRTPSLINNTDEEVIKNLKGNPVFNVIINNQTGMIEIYGNKFYNSTAPGFSSLINREMEIVANLSDPNNRKLDYINKYADGISNIKEQQFFTYCSKNNGSCFQ